MQPCDPALHWDSAALKWIHFQEIYGGVNLVFFHFGGSHLIFNSVLSFSTVPSCASLLYVMLMFVLDYRVVEAIAEAYFRSKRWQQLLDAIYFNEKWGMGNYFKNFSPRLSHLPRLHFRVWIEGPVHGLLVASHDRPLCWVPVPQVTVHSVHSDQGDQPSSRSLAGRSKRKHFEKHSHITSV